MPREPSGDGVDGEADIGAGGPEPPRQLPNGVLSLSDRHSISGNEDDLPRALEGVEYLLARFPAKPSDLLVIYDDMAIPVGRLRLRPEGSDGGHNGIRSIIQYLQTTGFPRLRIGIGGPPGDDSSIPHVLGRFDKEEEETIVKTMEQAVAAVECVLEENINVAMNRFNKVGE